MTFNTLYKIIFLYIALSVLVYFISNRSLFVPPPSSYRDQPETIKLTSQDGKTITAFYRHNKETKFVILYSHGNAEDLGMINPVLQEFYNLGLSVLSYDYQGYGTSDGRPTEKGTYEDINAAYAYLVEQQKILPQNIIVYGRSVGTGPSIELAMHKPIGALILEGAFVSAYRVVTHVSLFFPDKYNNLAKIKSLRVPILFIHGQDDMVIPIWHGKKLYDEYLGPKKNYWINDAGHNDVNYQDSIYKQSILNFIEFSESFQP